MNQPRIESLFSGACSEKVTASTNSDIVQNENSMKLPGIPASSNFAQPSRTAISRISGKRKLNLSATNPSIKRLNSLPDIQSLRLELTLTFVPRAY